MLRQKNRNNKRGGIKMIVNKCDRCNKEIKYDGIFDLIVQTRILLAECQEKYDLCENCKKEFYDIFLKNPYPDADEWGVKK